MLLIRSHLLLEVSAKVKLQDHFALNPLFMSSLGFDAALIYCYIALICK